MKTSTNETLKLWEGGGTTPQHIPFKMYEATFVLIVLRAVHNKTWVNVGLCRAPTPASSLVNDKPVSECLTSLPGSLVSTALGFASSSQSAAIDTRGSHSLFQTSSSDLFIPSTNVY